MIVIDELQHLVDKENDRVKRNVTNAIKRLLDVLKIPMVLAGMHEAKRIFGPSLETKRRTNWCFQIEPYDGKNDEDRNAFVQFLQNYDEALVERGCFKKSSNLSERTRAARLLYAARGGVGHVSRLIKAAGTLAIETGAPCISDQHFADACDVIFLDATFLQEIKVNPFRTKELPAVLHSAGDALIGQRRVRSRSKQDKQTNKDRAA